VQDSIVPSRVVDEGNVDTGREELVDLAKFRLEHLQLRLFGSFHVTQLQG